MHGRFPLFNSPHLRHPRSPIKHPGEIVQLFLSTDRVNANPAVVFVPHPAAQTNPVRVVPHEPTESDALHASRYKPLTRLGRDLAQFFCSPIPAPLISA